MFYKPKYYNDEGVAVFTSVQIDDYGLPENHGFVDPYYVVESREFIGQPTYEQGWQLKSELNNIHHYSRRIRFRTILGHLTGYIGFVTVKSNAMLDEVLESVTQFERDFTPPCMIWETLRKHLHEGRRQVFYNRIPAIAKKLKMIDRECIVTPKIWNSIIRDFDTMNEIFPRVRHKLARKYFPNLRFTALKLLEAYKVELPIRIPQARTAVKVKSLTEDYEKLWDYIYEELEKIFE
jgi:hypothetical protein